MNWISIKDELPNDGEFVFTYRPLAKETGDEEYTGQIFVGKKHKNKSPQGIIHGFDRWCHVTHWIRIEEPKLFKI